MKIRSILYGFLTMTLLVSETPAIGMWCLQLIFCGKKKHHEIFPIAPNNSPASKKELKTYNQLKKRQDVIHTKKKIILQLLPALNNSSDLLNEQIKRRIEIQYYIEEKLPLTVPQASPQALCNLPPPIIPLTVNTTPITIINITPLRKQKRRKLTSFVVRRSCNLLQRELNADEKPIEQDLNDLKQEYAEIKEDLRYLTEKNTDLTQKHNSFLNETTFSLPNKKELS